METWSRWQLYERCVQSPHHAAELLRTAHGNAPRMLVEDFAGSAAIAREWVRSDATARAVAIDLDAEALEFAGGVERLSLVRADARAGCDARADVVHAGNFSVGYLHARDELLAYLRVARARLTRGGILACDTYGGRSAFELGGWTRECFVDGARVVSTWEHRRADPITGLVENVLHFRVDRDGEVVAQLADAFVYRWRVWSPPELGDALCEAGFASSQVFATTSEPLRDVRELGADWSVCIVARA
jgi:hypothetical protein